MGHYLGLDVGSVTTKLVVVDEAGTVGFTSYLRTAGSPIEAVQESFRRLAGERRPWHPVRVGTTGSGRQLAALMAGADVVKNEITAHSVAARQACPDVRTVVDIGGQDSKIIFLRDGMCTGFNMNTVCAAGTGSFLDHQAARLGIPIEDLGNYALRSSHPARIAGRCGVFAESDLIHKQQMGTAKEDLVAGLCAALVANYLTNVARGKRILPPVLFQGGVAANRGIVEAFHRSLGFPVQVPEHFKVMGAWGAALLARRATGPARFRGVDRVAAFACRPRTVACGGCANACEINELLIDGQVAGRWGGRCPESPAASSLPTRGGPDGLTSPVLPPGPCPGTDSRRGPFHNNAVNVPSPAVAHLPSPGPGPGWRRHEAGGATGGGRPAEDHPTLRGGVRRPAVPEPSIG